MLVIDNLEQVAHSDIVHCLLEAFSDYFVPMPTSLSYWADRFAGARVDHSQSYGASLAGILKAFIIHGIDDYHGHKTAFNTGTGVIQKQRGQGLIDQLYEYAIPQLKSSGVDKCMLEVIQENERAIKVYERIGFNVVRKVKCYKGHVSPNSNIKLNSCDIEEVRVLEDPSTQVWDHTMKAIQLSEGRFKTYSVHGGLKEIGYFTINSTNGYLARLEAYEGDYKSLLGAIGQLNTSVRTNNIDERLIEKCKALEKLGWVNTIDQYEMELYL